MFIGCAFLSKIKNFYCNPNCKKVNAYQATAAVINYVTNFR